MSSEKVFKSNSPIPPVPKTQEVQKKISFDPQITYFEWLSFKGAPVYIFKAKTNAVLETIYTVPKGYTLFLTGGNISAGQFGDSGGEYNSVFVNDEVNTIISVRIREGAGVADYQVTNASFCPTIPYKVLENSLIRCFASSGAQTNITLYGFIVPNSILFN